jgi:hypothetical protein
MSPAKAPTSSRCWCKTLTGSRYRQGVAMHPTSSDVKDSTPVSRSFRTVFPSSRCNLAVCIEFLRRHVSCSCRTLWWTHRSMTGGSTLEHVSPGLCSSKQGRAGTYRAPWTSARMVRKSGRRHDWRLGQGSDWRLFPPKGHRSGSRRLCGAQTPTDLYFYSLAISTIDPFAAACQGANLN